MSSRLKILILLLFFNLSSVTQATAALYCFQMAGTPEKRSAVSWNEENLLPLLRAIHAEGIKLYASNFRSGENLALEAVIRREAGLGVTGYAVYKAVNRVFGNWEKGLLALGLDPKDHNAQIIWDRDEIIALLNFLKGKIPSLSQIHVRKYGEEIIQAYTLERFGHAVGARGFESRAIAIFKKWDAALRAVKVNPSSVHTQISWTPKLVIQAIQILYSEKFDLSVYGVAKAENPKIPKTLQTHLKIKASGAALHDRAIYYFKSWDAALQAAGIDPTTVRRVPPKFSWTRTRFFDAMLALEENGIPLNFELLASDRLEEIRPTLRQALNFSVSGNAVVQAGLGYFDRSWILARAWFHQRKALGTSQWSRDFVRKWISYFSSLRLKIDEISVRADFNGRHSLSMSLAAGRIILTPELIQGAEIYFGSWRNALLSKADLEAPDKPYSLPTTQLLLASFREHGGRLKNQIHLLNAFEEILLTYGPMTEDRASNLLSEMEGRPVSKSDLKTLFENLSAMTREEEEIAD